MERRKGFLDETPRVNTLDFSSTLDTWGSLHNVFYTSKIIGRNDMKTWEYEDLHFIEVDGTVYVEIEDFQRELAKLKFILTKGGDE